MDNKNYGKRIWLILVCALAAAGAIAIFAVNYSSNSNRVDTLLEFEDLTVWDPILRGAEGQNAEAQDALRLCGPIILTLVYGNDEAEWKGTHEILDELMEQFYTKGYLPREPYSEEVGDYVTSMDAPLLAVACELYYERMGDVRYRQYMKDLIPYLVADTEENGYVLKINDDAWWPLEYAWSGVSDETAWYVYNGSLFGMVCIELLYQMTGDERLGELSEKALNAYKMKCEQFHYPDDMWCYYSLDSAGGEGPIVNTNEKLLIEIRALRSLYVLTGESFYDSEAKYREQLLADTLPLYIVTDGDTNYAYLLRAKNPHPYQIDIYPNYIELLDAIGNVVDTCKADTRTVENAVIAKEVCGGVESYNFYARINSVDYTLLFTAPVTTITADELYLEMDEASDAGEWKSAYDAEYLGDNVFAIDSQASEDLKGQMIYTFEEGVQNSQEAYFVIEIYNPSENELPTRIAMTDVSGECSINRTGTTLKPGRNLILFSCLGFKAYSEPLPIMKQINIIVVTNNLSEDNFQLIAGNVYVFDKTAEVVEYLKDKEFSEFWVEAE